MRNVDKFSTGKHPTLFIYSGKFFAKNYVRAQRVLPPYMQNWKQAKKNIYNGASFTKVVPLIVDEPNKKWSCSRV